MRKNKEIITDMWVTCLDCYQEYVIEDLFLDSEQGECPICGCKTYMEPGDSKDWWEY